MFNFLIEKGPVVTDLIIVAIILLCALVQSKIGLLHTITKITIPILSIGVGFIGSKYLTQTVFVFVWEKISPIIDERFADMTFEELFSKSTLTLASEVVETVDSYVQQQVHSVAMLRAEMITAKVCSIGVFIVCFLVATIVFNLLSRSFIEGTKKSAIGVLDSLGGFVLGAFIATIVLTIIVKIFGFVNPTLLAQVSEGTTVLAWMEGYNIYAGLEYIKTLNLDDVKNIDFDILQKIDLKSLKEINLEDLKNIDLSQYGQGQ